MKILQLFFSHFFSFFLSKLPRVFVSIQAVHRRASILTIGSPGGEAVSAQPGGGRERGLGILVLPPPECASNTLPRLPPSHGFCKPPRRRPPPAPLLGRLLRLGSSGSCGGRRARVHLPLPGREALVARALQADSLHFQCCDHHFGSLHPCGDEFIRCGE